MEGIMYEVVSEDEGRDVWSGQVVVLGDDG